MATLTTRRLLLREFELSDWQAVQSYAGDPTVVRYLEWGPNTPEETRDFIRRAIAGQNEQPRRDCELAIVLNTTGQIIGGCRIGVSSLARGTADIGYCLHRDYWGQGYATEVAQALLSFGFERLGLHRISATCHVDNGTSARVLEKVGMHREGCLREEMWIGGHWHDSFLYAILDHEYDLSV